MHYDYEYLDNADGRNNIYMALNVTQGSLGFFKMVQKKRKYPVSGSSLSENVLLRSEVGDDRKATVTVTLCHSFQLRAGDRDSNSHKLTKIGQ